MTNREKNLSQVAAIFLSALTIVLTAPDHSTYEHSNKTISRNSLRVRAYVARNFATPQSPSKRQKAVHPFSASIGSPLAFAGLERASLYPNTLDYRIARRLKKRLRAHSMPSPNIHTLAEATRKRQEMLSHHVDVHLQTDDGEDYDTWIVSLQRYPTWIRPHFSYNKAEFTVEEELIASHLNEHSPEQITPPTDVRVLGFSQSGSVERTITTGIALPGYELDVDSVAPALKQALDAKQKELTASITYRGGRIDFERDGQHMELELLSTGRTNFKGSTYARMSNVRKALREHVRNVLVEPGAIFSFNETLDAPVTLGKGWRTALVIFNGDELKPAAGGGICQVSTTTFRAILNGGFPVIDRRSHSLFVTYYKKYGVGIDATIYPGSQDLTFLNDTSSPLIIQAYDTEDYDAIVTIYGVPDGRTVEMEGPFFASTAPSDLKVKGRQIYGNEIVWRQHLYYRDGRKKENLIVSRYRSIPSSLASEYVVRGASDELAQKREDNVSEPL